MGVVTLLKTNMEAQKMEIWNPTNPITLSADDWEFQSPKRNT